jgi:flagellar basal body-associated protein FliL
MADEQEQTTDEAPAKSGGMRGLIIYSMIAIIAAAGGFAVPMMFPQLVSGQPAEENAGPPKTVYVPFGETVVNLNEDKLNRYLSVKIDLQVNETDQQLVTELVEKEKPRLKNWLLSQLSELGMEDIRGAAGQNRLRREIHDRFNDMLFVDELDRINDVLFQDFRVQ